MASLKTVVQESYNELVHKVSWPSWKELQTSALVVAVASLIIALMIWAMDQTFSGLLSVFYDLFE